MAKKSNRKGKKNARESEVAVVDIPIPNLPDKFLWMHVNSGTKIRNVLNYALKEFPVHKSVVWSGAGQGIGKVITCVEICKKKNPGLDQITKLRYIKSKKENIGNEINVDRSVPEIHILLSKDSLDSSEPGHQSHQSSVDQGLFSSRITSSAKLMDKDTEKQSLKKYVLKEPYNNKLSNVATEEFAAMGLRTGQKRSHRGHQTAETSAGAYVFGEGRLIFFAMYVLQSVRYMPSLCHIFFHRSTFGDKMLLHLINIRMISGEPGNGFLYTQRRTPGKTLKILPEEGPNIFFKMPHHKDSVGMSPAASAN